jgi:murein DD-endopeptidase MepM/ murein hydrolase activator NlpD
MNEWRNRWAIRLIRADGRESHTLTASRPGMLAGAFAVIAGILAVGFLGGSAWNSRNERARVAALTEEVATLRQQGRLMSDLATRLEQMEADYARLHAAVTDGAPTAPPVALPADRGAASRGEASATAPAWPLAQRGFITRTYGSRSEEPGPGHPGVDIAVPSGSYVRAMAPGRVEDVGEDDVYGRYVRIAHEDGVSSLYGHNSWLFVQPGDSVRRLQVIALTGNTGRSTAPHLHFEVTRDGALVDPLVFVNEGGEGVVGRVGQTSVEQR